MERTFTPSPDLFSAFSKCSPEAGWNTCHPPRHLEVIYDEGDLQIGFNVSYLIDVMNVITDESVKITLANAGSSALIESTEEVGSLYVIMPMKM